MKKHNSSKRKKQQAKKIGQPPGTLVYIGDEDSHQIKPSIRIFEYDAQTVVERELNIQEIAQFIPTPNKKLWLNVHGVHDTQLIASLGQVFHIHPLVLEDIVNTQQRPKMDEFEHYVFLETRSFYYDSNSLSVSSEQISMVLGHNFLLTFQERATGIFEPVRGRLRSSHAHIRELGLDYLAYALIDSTVDRYFNVLEEMSDASEALENALLKNPSNNELHSIHQLKHACIELRRSVWPLREVVNSLTRNESGFFQSSTMPYLRDVYDHTVNFIESLEAIRDSLAGMMDIYMTSMSNRVNMELRALTVVAMLFMPATLIAGIFGMNFQTMPWLKNPDGFWWAMGLMIGIALSMGLIFWRRQWLSSRR
jgi:magnesium transporter